MIDEGNYFEIDRIKRVVSLANEMSPNFKSYLSFLKNKENNNQKAEEIINDYNLVLWIMIFSNCALFYPYFKMGYHLITSNFGYKDDNCRAKELVYKIRYNRGFGRITPYDSGIINWISAKEVNDLIDDFDNIVPSVTSEEQIIKSKRYFPIEIAREITKDSYDKRNNQYVKDFYNFLLVAKSKELGLISCKDVDRYVFEKKTPIGKDIDWTNYKSENIILFKE